jgi:CRISPR system Cascade subunit CasD
MNVLLLRLEAPLISLGGVAVDNRGRIDDLPSASLLAGLMGNAIGLKRTEKTALQRLQDRLRFAVRIDRPGLRVRDFQTAELQKDDKGWTTFGMPEGRDGGADSYKGQHIRYRDFHADAAITVAITLDAPDEVPTLNELAIALDFPTRPLFLGRKPCLPSARINLGLTQSASLRDALQNAPVADDAQFPCRIFEVADTPGTVGSFDLHGRRNWHTDVHEGAERWHETRWSPHA